MHECAMLNENGRLVASCRTPMFTQRMNLDVHEIYNIQQTA